ncbi:hypothetical protein N7456_004321 [Penicillium angulare]|uniref:Uncharacterized protein n=1 Tax=Penicillium angulare TaxID=116970 RepID=A0A9W9FWD2_9EURO|nr:hypothetical protein N7456_004321 [Penicillium angulare]
MFTTIYRHEYGTLDTLRHVLVQGVMNTQTVAALERCTGKNEGLFDSFERGSPEYQELLGTRIGRMVAYLVLGAFPRGTRKISRISCERTLGYNVRFLTAAAGR